MDLRIYNSVHHSDTNRNIVVNLITTYGSIRLQRIVLHEILKNSGEFFPKDHLVFF